jgi:hypothetical protein
MPDDDHERHFQKVFAVFHKKWAPKDADKAAEFMADLIILFRQAAHRGPSDTKH